MRERLSAGNQTRSSRGRGVQLCALSPLRSLGTLRDRRIVRAERCCSNVAVPEAGYLHRVGHLPSWLRVAIRIGVPRL